MSDTTKHYRLDVEQGAHGWWFVSARGGLLVTARTMAEALAMVPQALADIQAAAPQNGRASDE